MHTCWKNIAANVRLRIVDAIKATWLGDRSAIRARLYDDREHLSNAQVTRVGPLVCLAQENGAAFISLGIARRDDPAFRALFRRHQAPSLAAAITSFFARGVARAALIRQPISATFITQKNTRRCRKLLVAPIANFVTWLDSFSANSRHFWILSEVRALFKIDGPHYELPRGSYPA